MSVFSPCTYILTHAMPAIYTHLAAEMNRKNRINGKGKKTKNPKQMSVRFFTSNLTAVKLVNAAMSFFWKMFFFCTWKHFDFICSG